VGTGTGHWYRMGETLVEVRWVYVHDGTGTHRDEYCFTPDLTLSPPQIVAGSTQRWSIETTLPACRAYLQRESTQCYSQQSVLQLIPGVFGFSTIVALLSLQLPLPLQAHGAVCWTGKSTVTFSDMLTCVHRALWQQWFFHPYRQGRGFAKLSRALQTTILDALVPAA
jgi:hypothetical protein